MFSLLTEDRIQTKCSIQKRQRKRGPVLTGFIFYDNWRWDGRDSGEKERAGKAGWLCFFLWMWHLKEINAKHFRSHSVSLKRVCTLRVAVLKDQASLLVCPPRWLQTAHSRTWHQLVSLRGLSQGSSPPPEGTEALTCDLTPVVRAEGWQGRD